MEVDSEDSSSDSSDAGSPRKEKRAGKVDEDAEMGDAQAEESQAHVEMEVGLGVFDVNGDFDPAAAGRFDIPEVLVSGGAERQEVSGQQGSSVDLLAAVKAASADKKNRAISY